MSGEDSIKPRLSKDAGRRQAQKMYRNLKKECEICHATERLQIHHKDHDPTNNSRENIQILCASCHAKLHGKERSESIDKHRICPECGKEFVRVRSREKYCSMSCAQKAAWKRRGAHRPKKCVICGKDFIPRTPGVQTCSFSCRSKLVNQSMSEEVYRQKQECGRKWAIKRWSQHTG